MQKCAREGCLVEFELDKRWPHKKWCSASCGQIHNGQKGLAGSGLSKNKVGGIAELSVCADLLKRGYEVFRNVSSDGKVDVIAIKGKQILDIDIKTGYKVLNGNLLYPKNKIEAKYVAVFVHKDNEIHYVPKIKN